MIRFALPFCALTLALGACAASTASLSPAQCEVSWAAVGRADADDGEPAAKLARYREACARGGAPLSAADEAAWLDGWSGGAPVYGAYEGGAYEGYDDGYGGGYDNGPRGPSYPRIYPQLGVGIGSGGVSVGAGIGVGLGSVGLGLYY
ncbi:MAG: DUF2799 domain-containing protein [Paracoccaceae bacterium]